MTLWRGGEATGRGEVDDDARVVVTVVRTSRLILAVRGAAAVVFGLLTLIWPALTVRVLVLLYGTFALVNGLAVLAGVVIDRPARGRPWLVVHGLLGAGAGVVAFAWPGITAIALLYLIAAWVLLTGAFEVVASVRLRHLVSHDWLIGLLGLLSVALGLALVAAPETGALAITWLIGWWALVWGVTVLFELAQSRARRIAVRAS